MGVYKQVVTCRRMSECKKGKRDRSRLEVSARSQCQYAPTLPTHTITSRTHFSSVLCFYFSVSLCFPVFLPHWFTRVAAIYRSRWDLNPLRVKYRLIWSLVAAALSLILKLFPTLS